MKSSDKVAAIEFSKYTGSQKYKISKKSSKEDIEDAEIELHNSERNDSIEGFRPIKTTKIETLHDKMVGILLVKETKEYEATEYYGRKNSKIVHTKILGNQSYQTFTMLENDIQTEFQVKTDMDEEEVVQFQNKWKEMMNSTLIDLINQAIKTMPVREDMDAGNKIL